MLASEFREAGEILWGGEWKSAMVMALKVSHRNVHYWAAGTKDVPAGISRELRALIVNHIDSATAFLARL